MLEEVTGLQVQNQAEGDAASYVLWVTGEAPRVRMFWMLKGPDNAWTNAMKEKASGTKMQRSHY